MSILPIIDAACGECWSGYPGEHADWCSKSTAKTCVVCGGKYHQGSNGRCLLNDEAHALTITTQENAA